MTAASILKCEVLLKPMECQMGTLRVKLTRAVSHGTSGSTVSTISMVATRRVHAVYASGDRPSIHASGYLVKKKNSTQAVRRIPILSCGYWILLVVGASYAPPIQQENPPGERIHPIKKGQSGPSQIGFSTKDLFNVGLLETSPTGHFRYTCPLQGSDGPGFCPSFGLTKDFYSIYISIPTTTRGQIPTASPD